MGKGGQPQRPPGSGVPGTQPSHDSPRHGREPSLVPRTHPRSSSAGCPGVGASTRPVTHRPWGPASRLFTRHASPQSQPGLGAGSGGGVTDGGGAILTSRRQLRNKRKPSRTWGSVEPSLLLTPSGHTVCRSTGTPWPSSGQNGSRPKSLSFVPTAQSPMGSGAPQQQPHGSSLEEPPGPQ